MPAALPIDEMIRTIAREAASEGPRDRELVRRLLSVPRAAKYIDASSRIVYDMIADGEITGIKHGTRTKIDRRELDAWVERKKVEARGGLR